MTRPDIWMQTRDIQAQYTVYIISQPPGQDKY